jgi:hypothetical protein
MRPRNPNRGPMVRPPDPPGDFLKWPEENPADTQGVTALKAGSVYLNISLQVRNGKRLVDVWRSYPLPEKGPKTWSTVEFVEHVLSDAKLAQRYDVTAEQWSELKEMGLKIPTLTPEQTAEITVLFSAAEAAHRDALARKGDAAAKAKASEAEAALLKAAGKMTISTKDLDDLTEDAARAREILRPDQLDLIDSDFDRTLSGFDRPGYGRRRR